MSKHFIVWLITLFIATGAAAQQCASSLNTISYDTAVTGSGNDDHIFTFPKFDPTLGTLVSVTVSNTITLKYSFQLENKETFSINNYKVRVVREDDISSEALQNPITYTHQQTYGPFALAGSDGVTGSGPDYTAQGPLYVMNHTYSGSTVYNTGDYLGNGSVQFNFSSTTYSIVFGSVNYNYNGTAQDTTDFSITYTYCPTWFLAADISSFNAVKRNQTDIDINWLTLNEQSNRLYELQKSSDGRNFVKLAQIPAKPEANATGSYSYQYGIGEEDKRKLIFRVKQTEQNGTVKYSALRIVDVGNSTSNQPRLFPNPSNGATNLIFSNTKKGDWQVQVCSASGQVLQTYEARNALVLQLNTNRQLPKGLYFIRATNIKTQEQFLNRLLLQ